MFGSLAYGAETQEAPYRVLPEGTVVRGNLWIGDGIVEIFSPGVSTVGNRFRLGGELHFGNNYEYILGLTLVDRIWSSESAIQIGTISRSSLDVSFGYFVVPDKVWLMYSLLFQDLSTNGVVGSVSVLGHQLSVGYRFFTDGSFHVALEGAYEFIPSYTAVTYNFGTGATGTANFPLANIWSLNARIGFDIGGR